jgi:hypothetical protein
MVKYIIWNLWDNIPINGEEYNTIEEAVESANQYLLRFKKAGHYACANRNAISLYGVAPGSNNAYIPIEDLRVYIVDSEDRNNCGNYEDVGMLAICSVGLDMFLQGVNIECEFESNHLLIDALEVWNQTRTRDYGAQD